LVKINFELAVIWNNTAKFNSWLCNRSFMCFWTIWIWLLVLILVCSWIKLIIQFWGFLIDFLYIVIVFWISYQKIISICFCLLIALQSYCV